MRILADTSIWFRFVHRVPQTKAIETALAAEETRRYLSAISIMEVVQKWRTGKLDCPNPQSWLDHALEGFQVIPVNEPIARHAAFLEWDHKDPADRLIAATAHIESVELWHTDTVLRDLRGFPQRYFKAPPPL
jgi:PIN domain nuclease of toxin-antitoxin system